MISLFVERDPQGLSHAADLVQDRRVKKEQVQKESSVSGLVHHVRIVVLHILGDDLLILFAGRAIGGGTECRNWDLII